VTRASCSRVHYNMVPSFDELKKDIECVEEKVNGIDVKFKYHGFESFIGYCIQKDC